MLSIQEQIYGVSLIWSEAKYNFAFWNMRKNIDWDAEYRKALDNVMKPMEIIDYYLELMRFISLLNDGHTHVNFPQEINKNFMALPIKIKNYNGKHIITNVSQNSPIPIFSEIYKINGVDFDKYMNEKIMPYCWNILPTSSYERVYTVCAWVEGNTDKNAYAFIPLIEKNKDIEFSTSNGVFVVSPVLASSNIDWTLLSKQRCSENLTEIFKSDGLIINLTDDNVAVITLPTFMDDNMPANFYNFLSNIKSCKGFVIDIRDNGGGNSNNADAFSQAFIEGRFQTGKVKHAVHIGAYYAWGGGADFSKWNLDNFWEKKCMMYAIMIYLKKKFLQHIMQAAL